MQTAGADAELVGGLLHLARGLFHPLVDDSGGFLTGPYRANVGNTGLTRNIPIGLLEVKERRWAFACVLSARARQGSPPRHWWPAPQSGRSPPSRHPPRSRVRTPQVASLGHGVSHVINIVFDNVHFARDNPNVPSDLEQMPHLLNFLEAERHRVLEHAHADDRPHGRRQPDDLHGPVRRPARPARLQQLQDLQPRRDRPTRRPRSPTGRRPSSTPRTRRARVTTRRRRWSTPTACRPRPATRAASRRRRGCRSRARAARSATSRPRTWCSRTRPATCRPCSARARPRSPSSTPTPTRSRTRRSPTTSARRSTARRATGSARTRRRSSRARRPARRRPCPTSCRPSRAATTATRRCSARATSRRRSAAARTSCTTATR